MHVQILGMGHSLPQNRLSNQDLEKMVDTSHEWIVERTGICERRIAPPELLNSDLCVMAAQMALDRAEVQAADLDLIIVATTTPDMVFPATACIVQDKLGAAHAAAFDLEAGCTGFIYALSVAEKFLQTGACRKALVIGSEVLSRITDYQDRNTCVLFGDGAGAAVLGTGNKPGLIQTVLGADGSGSSLLYLPAGGSACPASHETVDKRLHYTKMHGNEVFRFASRIILSIIDDLLERTGVSYEDIDLFVPHQANLRIIQTAMKRLRIPMEKTLINIQNFGNMSSASIPVALSMADEEGRIKDGDLILSAAFGAGLTYGGALFYWGKE